MAYKKLIKVSNVCQVLDKTVFATSGTKVGLTFTCNRTTGTVTVNGTATASSFWNPSGNLPLVNNHKYLICGNYDGIGELGLLNQGIKDRGSGAIGTAVTSTEAPRNTWGIAWNSGTTFNNVTFYPQLFDLTEMYGAGHEPTTVDQFRQDFPEEMYDYSPYCWATSYSRRLKVSNVCQLLDKSKFPATTTKEGITWTNNGDGTITANGTATALTNILVDTVTPTIIKSGHKFLILGCPLSNGNITTSKEYWMQEGYEFCSDHGVGGFFSLKGNNINLRVYIQKDYTADNLTFKPQIFDLTEMYGAGHEPTTVEQFRADFPNELYDYKPYTIIPSYQRNLTCKTKNLFDINSAVKVSGGSSFSKNGNQITVSGNMGNRYVSANVLLDTSLVGKTVTFSAYAKTSDKNTACLRIQWMAPTGLASSAYVQSASVSGQGYQRVRLTGVIPTQPDDTYNMLCLSFYSNGYNATTLPSQLYTVVYTDIQLELGDTATDYVPYGHL